MTEPVDLLIFSDVSWGYYRNKDSMPPKTWRSLGPSKIANVLRKNGYTVQIINHATVINEEWLYRISKPFMGRNTIIGISTTFLIQFLQKVSGTSITYYDNIEEHVFIKVLKRLQAEYNAKILLGGPLATAYQKIFNADYVIKGYAENTILDLFDKIKNYGIRKIRKEWDIQTCNHRWHHSDKIQPGETLPLEVGRGCIYSCKFCKFDMMGKKRGTYVRDLSLIRDEIVENYEKYHVSNYMLMDDTFNDDVQKMEEWCKMIDSLPFDIQYTTYCRADLLYRYQEITRELYRTGMRGSTLGIETMNLKAGKIIGKPWGAKHGKDFIPYYIHDICKGRTLTQINFIIGLPGDSIDDVKNWVSWCRDNEIPSVQVHPLMIHLPKFHQHDTVFSDIDLNAEKYGYTFESATQENPYRWISDKTSLTEIMNTIPDFLKEISENFSEQPWSGFASLGLGYTIDDIINTPYGKLYTDKQYIKRTGTWIDNYVHSF